MTTHAPDEPPPLASIELATPDGNARRVYLEAIIAIQSLRAALQEAAAALDESHERLEALLLAALQET